MSHQLRSIIRGIQGYHEPTDLHWQDAMPASNEEQMSYSRVVNNAQENGTLQDAQEKKSKSLYISHFISTWNSRGFEFAAVLLLSNIYPGTLLPLSVYALCRALAAMIFSPIIGHHIDRANRLAVIRCSILGQRSAVAFSCIGFLMLLSFNEELSSTVQYAILLGLILLGVVEKLCIIMNTISVERDWVVVIADKDEALLQEMNSQMRRIDLFCKLVSPLAIALLDGFSSVVVISSTLVVNLISVLAEYFLIAWVYQHTQSLSRQVPRAQDSMQDAGTATKPEPNEILIRMIVTPFKQLNWYSRSSAFLPSLSLSLLYLTVLSFSGQMVTYLLTLQHPHFTSIDIGILRTIATLLEISATFLAPVLINHLGAVRAGIWSLCCQCLCLTPSILQFWTNDLTPSISNYIFILSVVLSRVCLWSFDLTAQLQVQNSVDANQRGSFSATEASLQNFFELCAFAMTIVWSKPEQFKYPATVSLVAVYVAAGCYAKYVRKERGHLLHVPCCESPDKSKGNGVAEGLELISNFT